MNKSVIGVNFFEKAINKYKNKNRRNNIICHIIFFFFLKFSHIFANIIPETVVIIVDMIVGKIISLDEMLPALSLMPMIVVGRSCKEVTFKMISIIILEEAIPSLLSSLSIALMPAGVAALPSPRMFADKLSATIF